MNEISLNNRNYLRQAPKVVNAKYTLTKSESDIILALLTMIDKDDKDFKDYIFSKEELEKKLNIKLDTNQLRVTIKSLMSKVIEIKKDNNKWEIFSLFSYFKYDNGTITCRFDKKMKNYYLQLQQYIIADFKHLIQIQSLYSRRIYLLLKEYMKFGVRKFNIEELQEILEAPKSYRARYNDFKRKVLLQAVKDINKYTDIEIKNIGTIRKPKLFEEHKLSRKVIAVTFHFKKNWQDLKSFIEFIREEKTNRNLYYSKLRNNEIVMCSAKGLLYYQHDITYHLTKEESLKEWEHVFENKEHLLYREEDHKQWLQDLEQKRIDISLLDE